jgi:hypothetical protein
MAAALRGGAPAPALHTMSTPSSLAALSASAPEGPGAPGINAAASGALGAIPGASAVTGGTTSADTSVEATLAQSQEMNLYYLQIQEQVNEQNRSFSTLSNVLKAEHDTVKTAIGNIR